MKTNLLPIIFLFVCGQAGAHVSCGNNKWISNYEQTEIFIIHNTEDLMNFTSLINNEKKNFQGKTVILRPSEGKNLDISANQWIPLGVEENRFMGIFDGEGNTISGLWIDTEKDYVGFFHSIGSEGKIKNLNIIIKDTGIKGGNRVGGLAGACYGEVNNCSVKGGNITGLGFSIGGLIGSAYSGSLIKDSHAETPVSAKQVIKLHIGGLIGYLDKAKVSNSYATGSVTVKDAITSDMGGLVGYQKKGTISACYATGTITVEKAENSTIGGLVGKQCDQIDQSYSRSRIIHKDTGDSNIGELAGLKLIVSSPDSE